MSRFGVALLLAVALILAFAVTSFGQVISSRLQSRLQSAGDQERIPVIITLRDKVDSGLFEAPEARNKSAHRRGFVRALKTKAEETQGPVRSLLRRRDAREIRQLWVVNSIAAKSTPAVIRELEMHPEIASIRLDGLVLAPVAAIGAAGVPEWNITAIHAPDLWSSGLKGRGVTVANMDTGVDFEHPDLNTKWRGGTNSWFDPHGEHPTPFDMNGHGTRIMGIMVGGDAGGSAIGVAPEARWISVKMYNDAGAAPYSVIHQSFQWLLDPDGDPDTDDAPEVINISWGSDTVDSCFAEFRPDIQALKTANIAVATAAGNYGPHPWTSVSPANYPESFAVGALDESQTIAYFSSRGPSRCDEGVFPEVVAPGVNIKTSDLTYGGIFPDSYVYLSGTSLAAPHAAGAMALLLSRFPNLLVPELESALRQSAVDLGIAGADDEYGYGLVDVIEAYNTLLASDPSPPSAAGDAYTVAEDLSLTVHAPGVLGNDTNSRDTRLTAVLVNAPRMGNLVLNPDGSFVYTPAPNFNGTDTFAYKAGNGRESNPAEVRITVTPVNDAPAITSVPVTTATASQFYAYQVTSMDPDPGDTRSYSFLTAPAGMTINRTTGLVQWSPRSSQVGVYSIVLQVRDTRNLAGRQSFALTVNRRINQPPMAVDDASTTRVNVSTTINVISNDSDPDGKINPATIKIVGSPRNGTLIVNRNGTVIYRPKALFEGPDAFIYTIRDNEGATSNAATVQLNVVR
jgi:serine protease AprX